MSVNISNTEIVSVHQLLILILWNMLSLLFITGNLIIIIKLNRPKIEYKVNCVAVVV